MPTSAQIRQQFMDYFVQRRGHAFVPSAPVVPHSDPTLLFTNAGMNQFKDIFLGTEQGPRDYNRVVNSQKCIRAGGKHNDLEDVGKDTYHHTFFEMMGNWSFGDYFKTEAIEWAWDLLTNVWGIDATRLHATYFEGDASEGLEPDTEARDLWLKILPPQRVHPGNKKDNFWEMGDSGPCGPCSEIHIDRTPDKSGGSLINADDARVMEIWNLVFIQFNRAPAPGKGQLGKLSPLPAKHVDTGLGFERVCAVLQDVDSNYDTDVFTPIFAAIREVTGAKSYGQRLDDPVDMAYRVIADHIRCLTFAITDGAVPSNDGRGYVLRRILRRAVRHGWQTMGMHEPFLHRLVAGVVDAMGDAFPELRQKPDDVAAIIREEEKSFDRTIDRGIALFEEAAHRAKESGQKSISAEDAFKLHDTFGFPLDLTQVMAEERGMMVDTGGFDRLMEQARQLARGGAGKAQPTAMLTELVRKEKPPATTFLGYEVMEDQREQTVHLYELADDRAALVLEATPFYAEAGGQVGDTGTITVGEARFEVQDTTRIGEAVFHIGTVHGTIQQGGKVAVTAAVDSARRSRILANHTGTHMLNHKLRAVLGDHVQQKGSLVDDEKLRFDFSHNAAMGLEELEKIEQLVNADIAADLPVYAEYAPLDDAQRIHSLRAVFGEKYPQTVRVVSIGVPLKDLLDKPDNQAWYDYSIEFCGGTHLPKTGEAEGLVIVHEEAVAKGVRRIVALTGAAAHQAQANAEMLLNRVHALKNATAQDLSNALADVSNAVSGAQLPAVMRGRIREQIAELQKIVKEYEKQRTRESAGSVVEDARRIAEENSGPLIVAAIEEADAQTLRTAMDVIRKKHPEAALLLGAVGNGKVSFIAAVPQAMIDKGLKAGDWVRDVAKVAGGGGGGRPDMAQAGGKDPEKLQEALEAGRTIGKQRIGA